MENKIIYLDSAAKTITYKEVLDAYLSAQDIYFANPSSIHFEGVKATRALEKSKEEILKLLKTKNHSVVFVSSATEANNLALKGFALRYKNRGKHIIVSSYEHPSIKDVVEQLKNEFGFEITYIDPDEKGVITAQKVLSAIREDTILVSIMAVNNEIGTINPISEIAKELKNLPKIAFHCDAAQAVGKIDIDYSNVDMFTVSSHKIHGLVSGGCLLVKKNLELSPLLNGGGQEYGLRSGTVDTASALAFVTALRISLNKRVEHFEYVKTLAAKLYDYLNSHKNLYEINSEISNPYIVNFSTITKKSSVVVEALSSRGIMVSSTSACSSYKQKGSYVVKALGKNDNVSNNTVRVSFSYLNTIEEVETFINTLDKIIGEIR